MIYKQFKCVLPQIFFEPRYFVSPSSLDISWLHQKWNWYLISFHDPGIFMGAWLMSSPVIIVTTLPVVPHPPLLTISHIPALFMAFLLQQPPHNLALRDLSLVWSRPPTSAFLYLSFGSYHDSQSSSWPFTEHPPCAQHWSCSSTYINSFYFHESSKGRYC